MDITAAVHLLASAGQKMEREQILLLESYQVVSLESYRLQPGGNFSWGKTFPQLKGAQIIGTTLSRFRSYVKSHEGKVPSWEELKKWETAKRFPKADGGEAISAKPKNKSRPAEMSTNQINNSCDGANRDNFPVVPLKAQPEAEEGWHFFKCCLPVGRQLSSAENQELITLINSWFREHGVDRPAPSEALPEPQPLPLGARAQGKGKGKAARLAERMALACAKASN